MDAQAVADGIEAQLRAAGAPERAEHERRYLKSELGHHGVPVPAVRRIATAFDRAHEDLSHGELVALVAALWDVPVHERRLAAVELVARRTTQLSVRDAPLLERLLREARTWALLDPLAVHVVGVLTERDPTGWDPVVRRWAVDGDFWLRRASLLTHLVALRQGAGDFQRFGELADGMLDEQEFFIRKAIGWVLRDTGRHRPDLVAGWLAPRVRRAAGLTVREAVKHLPDTTRERILAARQG